MLIPAGLLLMCLDSKYLLFATLFFAPFGASSVFNSECFTFGLQPPIQPPKPKTEELKVLEEIRDILKDIREKPRNSANTVVHKGIFCNMCQQQDIRGIRYKCHTCMDYDICEACEVTNIHPHNFIRIKKP
jgi:hypothetical protein